MSALDEAVALLREVVGAVDGHAKVFKSDHPWLPVEPPYSAMYLGEAVAAWLVRAGGSPPDCRQVATHTLVESLTPFGPIWNLHRNGESTFVSGLRDGWAAVERALRTGYDCRDGTLTLSWESDGTQPEGCLYSHVDIAAPGVSVRVDGDTLALADEIARALRGAA